MGEVFEDFAEEVDGAGDDEGVAGGAEGALAGGGENFGDLAGMDGAGEGGRDEGSQFVHGGGAGLVGLEEDDFLGVAGGDFEEGAGAGLAEGTDEEDGGAVGFGAKAGELLVEGLGAFGVVGGVEDEGAVFGEGKFLPAGGPVYLGEGGGNVGGGNREGFFEDLGGEGGGGGVDALMGAGEAGARVFFQVVAENFADAVDGGVLFAGDGADGGFGFGREAAEDDGDIGFDDAGFFAGDFFEGVAEEFLVVEGDGGDDGELGEDDVGGVEAAAEADFDEGDVHFFAGEVEEGDGGHELEEGGEVVGVECGEGFAMGLEFGNVGADFVGGEGLAVDLDAFAEEDEVGGSIHAGGATGAAVDGLEYGADRALAVSAGDVDDGAGEFGVAEAGGEQLEAVDTVFGADLLLEAGEVGFGGKVGHEEGRR